MSRRSPLILYVGTVWPGSNAASFAKAFHRVGVDCVCVDATGVSNSRAMLDRIRRRVGRGSSSQASAAALNRRVLATGLALKPDVLFISKGMSITPETLSHTPAGVKIHYHPDDILNPAEVSPTFRAGIPLWDLHLTTRAPNVADLRSLGAKDVLRLYFAYDRDFHRPVADPHQLRYHLGFVGTRRTDRRALVEAIAERFGRAFLLCGDKWGRSVRLRRKATLLPSQYGLAMSSVIARSRVCLGLLNSDNRDQHTYRTFEIPAAGGLLLAQRTDEHVALFGDDGQNAVLFSSFDELCDSADRLVADTRRASAIAGAGCRLITQGHNTYEDRVAQILNYVGLL